MTKIIPVNTEELRAARIERDALHSAGLRPESLVLKIAHPTEVVTRQALQGDEDEAATEDYEEEPEDDEEEPEDDEEGPESEDDEDDEYEDDEEDEEERELNENEPKFSARVWSRPSHAVPPAGRLLTADAYEQLMLLLHEVLIQELKPGGSATLTRGQGGSLALFIEPPPEKDTVPTQAGHAGVRYRSEAEQRERY